MKALLTKICASTKSSNNAIHKLRDNLIGCHVHPEAFIQLGYQHRSTRLPNCAEWSKHYNRGSECVSMIVIDNSVIAAIDTKRFYDLSAFDGGGAPYGYMRTGSLSSVMHSRVMKELTPNILESAPTSKSEFYNYYFNILLDKYEADNHVNNNDLILGSLIGQCYEKELYPYCSLLSFLAYRFIEDIEEPYLLMDMAYYFGRLGFADEFSNCLNHLSSSSVNLPAETLCNLGAVLCDSFQKYELSIECFLVALQVSPKLWQAKQGIYVAGMHHLLEIIQKQEYEEALALGSSILKVASDYRTDADLFFSYLGLAAEMSQKITVAKQYYQNAKIIRQNSKIADERLKVIDHSTNSRSEIRSLVAWETEMASRRRFFTSDKLFHLKVGS